MTKNRPRRLDLFYQARPLFFVTFSTRNRIPILDIPGAHETLRCYATKALAYHIAVGRYVLMPDHIHLFVQGGDDFNLSRWVGGLKRAISVANGRGVIWQPGFFDHVLRSDKSYSAKWEYLR